MDARQRGTELIGEIGNCLVHDETYLRLDWQAFSVVFTTTGSRTTTTGFAYLQDGSVVPGVPNDPSLDEFFTELSEITARPDGKRWIAALIQVVRSTGEINLEFEWDDIDRWRVTPANLAARREELRPVA